MASRAAPAKLGVARRARAAASCGILAAVIAPGSCRRASPPPGPAGTPAQTTAPATAPSPAQLVQLLGALGATRACDRFRGTMIGLRDPVRHAATGTLWVRTCDVSTVGDRTTLTIAAQGWQAVDGRDLLPAGSAAAGRRGVVDGRDLLPAGSAAAGRRGVVVDGTRRTATGTYVAREVERFDVSLVATGWIGVRYDAATRSAGLAFAPARGSAIRIAPTSPGAVLPAPTLRGEVLGALVGALAAPEREPPLPAAEADVLVHGLDATLALCTGTWYFTIPGVGAAADLATPTPLALAPGELAVSGPFTGPRVTIDLAPHDAAAQVSLACASDAAALAGAYLEDRPLPQIQALATAGPDASSVHVDHPTCPVALVVRAVPAATAPVQLRWTRPADELAASQRPALRCRPSDRSPHVSR